MKLSADLISFQTRLGYTFGDPSLLIEAVTHSSMSSQTRRDNQRLEFLGDRVLGLVIAQALFEKDIDESLTGKKVVTTSNPDTNKTTLPGEKLCMVMGLGPKGLPKSYING